MTMNISTLAALFPLLLLLLGLTFTVVIDPYIRREHRHIMLLIAALCLTHIAQNVWDYALTVGPPRQTLRTILSIYGYSVRPVILILFLNIVQPTGKRRYYWLLAGLNAAVYLSALFSPVSFWIDQGNYYHGGPLAPTCLISSAILLICLLVQTLRSRRTAGKWDVWIPIAVIVMIVVSIAFDYNIKEGQQPVSFLTVAIIIGSVFYYIWLHLQFVREHEKDLMASQRIQIMMTQIQPHFLFNALNTIRALYSKDPSLADRTLEDFSTYLRQNLESLSQTDLVPVTKELEHTRLYAEIEVLRFPNIHVEYRTWDQDFQIPALTIQPLVENAIRHGVRSRKDGLVTVTTVCESGCHRITVQDNGVGFDTKKQESFAETHIGLRNVKNRIEQMCGGTMILGSEIGAGTCVTLIIPDGNKDGTREKRK
ncbi:MAG: histidine kinase [Oscillospiraceae bacterium]|nr:histidine kinase [Oscillospiraceae bacterium]